MITVSFYYLGRYTRLKDCSLYEAFQDHYNISAMFFSTEMYPAQRRIRVHWSMKIVNLFSFDK